MPSSIGPEPVSTVKKRHASEDSNHADQGKRKAKRRKTRESVAPDSSNHAENFNPAIAGLNSQLLADHVAQRTKRFAPELSAVELQDRYIPERAFCDTSGWNRPRILDNLPSFMDHFTGGTNANQHLCTSSKDPGCPHTLLVTSSGIRAADITRALRVYQTDESSVAKLFAKHIKFKDAVSHVKRTRIGIGVGTPSRINDLLDSGALSPSALERVIVDASYVDQKKRSILDMKDTALPLIVSLLNRGAIKERYGHESKAVELLFY